MMKKNSTKGYLILGIMFILISVIAFVIPTVKTVAEKVKQSLLNWSVPHVIIAGEKERYDAFAAADVALAAD